MEKDFRYIESWGGFFAGREGDMLGDGGTTIVTPVVKREYTWLHQTGANM